jgi:hypothetical protein
MREQELVYLRDEQNQYIKFSNESTHKLIGHIILLWGGALYVFGKNQEEFMGTMFVLFMVATVFFISVLLLYFLARREYTYFDATSRIGSYIAMFHEERPVCCAKSKQNDNIFWELVLCDIETRNKKWDCDLKSEKFWLSVIAIAIQIFLFIVVCYKRDISFKDMKNLDIIMSGGCIFYFLFSILLSIKLFFISFLWPDWRERKLKYLNYFKEYAVETGYYSEDDIKNKFGETYYNKICESS